MSGRAPRAILFDWDNTLVDSWHIIHGALNATFQTLDMAEWPIEQTKSYVRRSMRESFPELFGERAHSARDLFLEHYARLHLDRVAFLPGAERTISGLADAGVYLGVLSNKQGTFVRAEASHLAVDHAFSTLVGAEDGAVDKPARGAVMMALGESGIEPGPEVYYVGDTGIDVVCARNADCVSIVIGPDEPRDGDTLHEPDHHFPDHDAFQGFLRANGIPI